MDLVHERDGEWLGIVRGYSVDLAFGDADENDFTVEVPELYCRDVDGSMIGVGDCLLFPETEWGGVVDGVEYDNTGDYPKLTYTGRTWHGLLSKKVVRPDAGQDYYTVSGDVHSVLSQVIQRVGLSDVMEAVAGDQATVSSYSFDRYTDAYTGLCKMLKTVGMRLAVRKGMGKCQVSAVTSRDVSQGVDDNFLRFSMGESRPVNHLVCLGEGELSERVVVDLYMDGSGAVSQTQTFTGVDEIAEVYESNNEDAAGLVEKGTERLQDYYVDASTIDAEIPDEVEAHVGDRVTGRSVTVPVSVTADVSTITVKAKYGDAPEVSYKVGSVKVL